MQLPSNAMRFLAKLFFYLKYFSDFHFGEAQKIPVHDIFPFRICQMFSLYSVQIHCGRAERKIRNIPGELYSPVPIE